MKFEKIKAKTGADTLKINLKYVHSRFDPEKEAERAALNLKKYKTVLIIGSGLGYIEKELEKLNIDFLSLNPPEILKEGQLSFNYISLLKERLRSLIVKNGPFGLHIHVNPAFKEYFKDETALILKAVSYIAAERRMDIATKKYFIVEWLLNYKENFSYYLKSPGVKNYFKKFQGDTAVIAGAGPSLEKDIIQLKKYYPYVYIVAVDTSLKYLVKNGVVPDFLITIDSQENNLKDFEGVEIPEKTVCIFDVFVNPGIPPLLKNTAVSRTLHNIFDGEKYTEDENPFLSRIFKITGDPGGLQCGGSVSTSALHFCFEAGFKNIVLAGQDLSFTGGKMHSSDIETAIALPSQNKFFTVELFNFLNFYFQPKIKIKNAKNKESYTTRTFLNYKKWFEDAAEKLTRAGVNFFNITADGVNLSGFKNIDLKNLNLNRLKKDVFISRAENTGKKEEIKKLKNFLSGQAELHGDMPRLNNNSKSPFLSYFLNITGYPPDYASAWLKSYFNDFKEKLNELL